MHRLSRTLHKWLALLFGIQVLLWTLSGFYMVVVDLDFIHGDPLVRNLRTVLHTSAALVPFTDVAQRYPSATQISLRALPGNDAAVYEVTTAGGKVLLDAGSGRQLSPLSAGMVRALACSYYAGTGQLRAVQLIEHEVPSEIRGRVPPLWRADFDDWLATTLYLHPDSGALVTRRHRFWRWYDFLWMLHIMDYETRDNMNNAVLRVSSVLGMATVLTGGWLLYFTLRRNRRAASSPAPATLGTSP